MPGSYKRDLASGLVILIPLLVTFYAIRWLYFFIADLPLVWRIAPTLPVVGAIDPQLSRVVFTLVTFVGLVMGFGYMTRTALGGVLEDRLDRAINRIPGFRMVYNASKVAVETAVSGDIELKRPAKIDLWGNVRLTAFRTGKWTRDGRQILFVPTSPNVTSGFVVEVDEEDVMDPDESLEEALTRVISAGFGERHVSPAEIETPEVLEAISQERREAERLRREGNSGESPEWNSDDSLDREDGTVRPETGADEGTTRTEDVERPAEREND